MDNLEDEGYTSPSEVNYSEQLSHLTHKTTSTTTIASSTTNKGKQQRSKIKCHPSWDNLSLTYCKSRQQQQSGYQNAASSYLTDDKEHSSKVVDNLWLLSPEISGYHSLTANLTSKNSTRTTSIANSNGVPSLTDVHSHFSTTVDLGSKSIFELTTRAEKPEYLPLPEFLSHAVDLLCGRQSKVFYLYNSSCDSTQNTYTFLKNPTILINGLTPSTMSNYCEPLLVIGSLVLKLSHIHLPSKENHRDVRPSKVLLAFINFIKDYIKVYKTVVMLKQSSILTLTMLQKFIRPFSLQLHMLMKIATTEFNGNPLTLLKNLNDLMLQHETPCLSEMLQSLFITCSEAYTRYVSEWIFYGALGPPSEFHIVRNKIHVPRDRRFWTHQFTQVEDVPLFLRDIKTSIFETGKVINLLKELKQIESPACFDDDSELKLEFHLSHNGITELMSTFEKKMSQFLDKYGYLLKEIEETVRKTAIAEDLTCIDSYQLEENRKEFEAQFKATQLIEYLETRKKKQAELHQVQHHLKEARNMRLRQTIDDLFEENKRKSYWEAKDQEEVEKGYKLLNEYYGDFLDTDEIKNILTTPKREIKPNPTFQHTPLVANIENNHNGVVQEKMYGSGDSASVVDTTIISPTETYGGIKIEQNQDMSDAITCISNCVGDDSSDQKVLIPNVYQENDKDQYAEKFSFTKNNECQSQIIKKLKSKDFKTRFVAPVELDLQMFDRTLIPSKEIETVDEKFSNESEEFLTHRFISLSIEISLTYRNKVVNLALLHHIIVTKQLFRHVKALQDFLLLQNGLFGHFLSNMLIDLVQKKRLKMKKDIMSNIFTINSILEEALSMCIEDEEVNFIKNRLSFAVIEPDTEEQRSDADSSGKQTSKRSISSEFNVLNSLYLRYTFEWPLNIIFSDDFTRRYENIFRLQMRLLRAELLLGKVATVIKSKCGNSTQLKELNVYRYYFLHFVRAVRNYINVTVIHSSWTELTALFCKMDSLEKIYVLLRQYVKNVTTNCLLGPKASHVVKFLINQLIVIEAFCSALDSCGKNINWGKGEHIPSQDYKHLVRCFNVYKELEAVFVQVAANLVEKGIYPKVSLFLELLNFNNYFKLKR